MPVAADTLARIQHLYDRGLYLQALAAGEALGPIADWSGVEARVLAGRLANNLGATRLGHILHRLAFRGEPDHGDARYFHVLAILRRRGLLAAWDEIQRLGEPAPLDDRRGEWWALVSYVLALFRDFARAEETLQKAHQETPDRPWIFVQTAAIRQLDDRHDEALESAQRALELEPYYRPAVQSAAHLLVQANRTDEALDLLEQAAGRLESGDVLAQWAALQTELELYDDARGNWERVESHYPLLRYEKDRGKWLLARRSDAAYYCGDLDEAARLAREADTPFHRGVAERIEEAGPDARRVLLPVGFVRQHHLTCSPATLTALSQFFESPADHLELAETICYDGTPAHSERKWAEDQGYAVREFRITWESAVALIDAGFPFTLTTIDPGNAHLQAVIGYDQRRGTLLIRDPSERSVGEFRGAEMIEHYQSTGPRGMVFAPAEKRADLEAIDLPEAALYDYYYAIQRALETHDRAAAGEVVTRMKADAPEHRLTDYALRMLGGYDADVRGCLDAVERLLDQYPKDVNLQIAKLGFLAELGRRDQRTQMLRELVQAKDADPLFVIQLARELSDDSRKDDETSYLLSKAIRARPTDAECFELLGHVCWSQQRHARAVQLYRFAACLSDKDEALAKTYFSAARHLKQTDQVLEFLRQRRDRLGALSTWPARTLAWAYEQLERPVEAFQVFEDALESVRQGRKVADEGELKLAAARQFLAYGKTERADQLLAEAQAKTPPAIWLRSAAALATLKSDRERALQLWRKVLEQEPLASDANESVAQLISETEGDDAALAHVRGVAGRFPNNYALRRLRLEWESKSSPQDAEQAARQLLDDYPGDAWARRELAICLLRQQRHEEAAEEARAAEATEPFDPIAPAILGSAYESQGNLDAAKAQYERAIRITVDYEPAIDALMRICDSKQQRIAALRFIADELVRQVNFGAGLQQFRYYGAASLDEAELLELLRNANHSRPDLWQSWSVLAQQLVELNQLDDALATAKEAVQRFPLQASLWLELADIHRRRAESVEHERALQKALEISPGWSDAERQLAKLHRSRGELEPATDALQRAVRREPLDSRPLFDLAEIQWERGLQEEALATMQRAVELEPGFEAGWDLLKEWSEQSGQNVALEAAERLTQQRPDEARSWLVLADVLEGSDPVDRQLEALQRAVEKNPRSENAYDRMAQVLADQGRFDEALTACSPPAFQGQPPLLLRARGAQVEALRGNNERCVEQLREVLEADPDYPWAWMVLADALEVLERDEECLEACQEMVRTAPESAQALGYRGDAYRRLNQRAEAKRDFERALELAPQYLFALRHLLEMSLQDGEGELAERVFNAHREQLTGPFGPAYEVRVAVQLGRPYADALRATFREAGEDLDPVHTALRAWDWEEIPIVAVKCLREALEQQWGPASLGDLWARLACQHQTPQEVAAELTALKSLPGWPYAVSGLLESAGEHGDAELIQRMHTFQKRDLKQNDVAWASMGMALADIDDRPAAVAWLQDWRERELVEQGTLFTLAISHRVLGNDVEARQTHAAALDLPADDADPYHRLWLAIDAFAAGDAETGARFTESLEGTQWSSFYEDLAQVARTLTDCAGPRKPAYRDAVAQLAQFYSDDGDVLVKRTYWRCRAALAGCYGYRLRAWWFRLRARWS